MARLHYYELRNRYNSIEEIPYSELLSTADWIERRDRIVLRDKSICTSCGKYETVRDYSEIDPETGTTNFVWVTDQYPLYKNDEGILIESKSPLLEYSEKPYFLHVHHKFYVLGRLPWEYNDDALITLCNWCHWNFHTENKVPVYKMVNQKLEQVELTPCKRCNGTGWFPEFGHIQNGICFRCHGTKFEELIRN